MIEKSKARFEKAQHLVSFELIDPELFLLFKTSFPQNQRHCKWTFPNDLQRETKRWADGDVVWS